MSEVEDAEEERAELVKEGCTMALYVAVCLLAAFAAIPEHDDRAHTIPITWGVTIGLALAHWFAFRVSARLVGDGRVRQTDVAVGVAQLAGAACVAVLASVPALLAPSSVELDVVTYVLAAFIAVTGYVVARSSGAGAACAVVYAVVVLVVAVAIAAIKNTLAGH